MAHLASRLPQVGTTIFSVMSALARKHQAINLSQGFPDFAADPRLMALVTEAMAQGFNQYAPMTGDPSLRAAIAAMLARQYKAQYDVDQEITVVSGATEGLFCAIMALTQAGDEVMVLEPAYDSYLPGIAMAGAKAIRIPLQYPDYHIDWQQVKDKLTDRTKALIINSPHNPTGSVLGQADIEALKELIELHPLHIISDEVYEFMVFDGQQHESMARYPELAARSMVVSSFGKSVHATGWKTGYCLAPAHLSREFRKVHQFVTFSTSTPFQRSIAAYMTQYPEELTGLAAFYQQKRDLFLELTAELPFDPLPSRGTYFQLMRYDRISDMGDQAFAEYLTREIGVAAIPVSAFYADGDDHGVVRFCFAKKEETLRAAADRLKRLLD